MCHLRFQFITMNATPFHFLLAPPAGSLLLYLVYPRAITQLRSGPSLNKEDRCLFGVGSKPLVFQQEGELLCSVEMRWGIANILHCYSVCALFCVRCAITGPKSKYTCRFVVFWFSPSAFIADFGLTNALQQKRMRLPSSQNDLIRGSTKAILSHTSRHATWRPS